MIVIWQGYGYIALAAFLLPLAGCVGLIDFDAGVGALGAGVGFLIASAICFFANRSLRRAAERRAAQVELTRDPSNPLSLGGSVEGEMAHSLYFVPLWVWVWVYGTFGTLLTVMALFGFVAKALKK